MFSVLKMKKYFFKNFSTFRMNDEFIALYKDRKVDFGFNGLGNLVYKRTYSRLKDDGMNEEWHETVRRVVEGCFNLLL
jgi:ribonucleoside-triphosphate reductase